MDLKPSTYSSEVRGFSGRTVGLMAGSAAVTKTKPSEHCTTHYKPRVTNDSDLDAVGSPGAGRPGRGWQPCSVAARPVASSSAGPGAGAPARLAAAGGQLSIRRLAGSRFASPAGGDPRGSATPAADVNALILSRTRGKVNHRGGARGAGRYRQRAIG